MFGYSLLLPFILSLNWKNVCSLYEDQIGKFDWKEEFIGSVKFSVFDKNALHGDVVFVATEENVVASLSQKTGEIKWRKVLEKGNQGTVTAVTLVNNVIYVVTGIDVVVIRGWHAKNGYLVHQWSPQLQSNEFTQRVVWFTRDSSLFQVTLSSEQILRLTEYRIFNGDKIRQKSVSHFVGADPICAVDRAMLLCSTEGRLLMTNFTSMEPVVTELMLPQETSKWLSIRSSGNGRKVAFVIADETEKFLLCISSDSTATISKTVLYSGDIYVEASSSSGNASSIILIANRLSLNSLHVEGLAFGQDRTVFSQHFTLKQPFAKLSISGADCNAQVSGNVICSLLISTSDGSVIFLKSDGTVEWVREEALASIITAEMIELPMSDTEAEMQTEFDAEQLLDVMRQAADVLSMFLRRISSHVFQLQKSILGLSGVLENTFSTESHKESRLVRDYFNLHKIILIITKQAKMYAMDNVNKEVLWSYLLDEDAFEPFPAPSTDYDVRVPLFIQRTYRHYPHPMRCTILLRDRESKNGVIVSFNPITGIFELPVRLNYKIKQATLLPKQSLDDYLQGIVILSEDDSIHVYPEHTRPILLTLARNLFFHVAHADACQVDGYTFGSSIENMTVTPAWNMKCTGKIIKISGKNPIEKVHSQGRVLSDRSVLYKYINPNLIAIVSQSINPEDQKSMLTLYFVDSVTGVIVNGDVRHRASDPVHLVHSENWVVLMYFNEKARRTEVVTYELYEGKTQKNSTAFSSIQTKSVRPIIDSRAYILPTSYIEAAKETITEKGITSKHVLVALSTGNVIELPWIILDPRRPFAATPEMKEEGILPYMPELPIPTETMINYNQTLHRIRGILTSPSGLESTSLIFVYGLDIFYTRTAPSKTFDLLKEDFDYTLIVIVLLLLVVLTFVTKHLAYRRALRQAWR